MCDDFEQQIAWADYCALMQAIELGIPTNQTELDLPPAADVRITDMASVLVDDGDGPRLHRMSFGFPSAGKGGPIFNFRSEGRSFENSKRAVIPMSAFYEFTGTKSPKAKHCFTVVGSPVLGVAGLWREGKGNAPNSFTPLAVLADIPPTDFGP